MIKSENTSIKLFFETAKKETKTSDERKELLNKIAQKIAFELSNRDKVNLNFICTHNSRRSQISQAWAFYASKYFNIKNIQSFSGGTEVTAFHKNTVKTLQSVGFNFNIINFSHQNPTYAINFEKTKDSILGFSKKYDNENNSYPYIAITTCGHADENCPFIPDALERYHLPYVDPKSADNTPSQSKKYLETNQQIAAEMHLIFKEVSKLTTT